MNDTLAKNLSASLQRLLHDERLNRSITRKDFAAKSGLSRQYVAMLEDGKRIPRLDTLFQIAQGLNMQISQLVEILQGNLNSAMSTPTSMAADSGKIKWITRKQ
ncbi:hypothetical protein AGMMS49938_04160 [Fibrobacterales bacterium]|nr:hypothetical protein AGMMS49938_04160 [Fibrobacterales bacterium]